MTSANAEVEIREARTKDAEGLTNLLNIAYNHSYPISELTDTANVRKILKNKKDIWCVATIDDKIVGEIAGTCHRWNRTYETCRGVTHPDYRRLGIARKLYETILEEFYKQDHCDLTFGFPRTFGMYEIMSKGSSNPLLLTGHDGGMHMVDNKREQHLMGINKNPHRKLTRVIPSKSKFIVNRFIVNNILSKIKFENEIGEYPNISIVGPNAQNYAKLNGIELGYIYISTSLSMQIVSLSNNHNQDIKFIMKNIQGFFKESPFPIKHAYMYILADKENFIKEMCKIGFEIVSYLPAWYYENNKRYDCVMLVNSMYKEKLITYGTYKTIKNFELNFKKMK